MRMDDLLADIEAAEAAARRAEMRAETAEGARAERARVTLHGRLAAGLGTSVAVSVAGTTARGRLVDLAEPWLAIDRHETLHEVCGLDDLVRPGVTVVALGAIEAVTGLSARHTAHEIPTVGAGWGSLLRAVARGRGSVLWRTRSGATFVGVIEVVGADHVIMRRTGGEGVMLALAGLACLETMTGRPEATRR